MKKILFLTRSYPDTLGSATILCMHRVLNCLAESGRYDLHVLSMCYPNEESQEMVGNAIVHRMKPTLWQQMRNSLQKSRKHQKVARIMEVMTKAITIPTYPRTEPLTDRIYTRDAMKLQKEIGFDLVVSEHHGLTTLLAGCRLAEKYPDLKHIALLWDPVKGEMATVKLPSSFTTQRINKVEEFVARYTTLQISFRSIQPYYQENGDVAANHRIYLDVPSIIKPEDEVPTKSLCLLKSGYVNVVFSGLLSEQYRDALPIIRLLNQCEVAEKINFVFFSRGEKETVEAEAKNFKGTIVYHDYIPLAELHTIYRHADYLLNVSHINANMVPSKIFEYMSYGKPIISTYVTDGDAAKRYISKYPESVCLDLKSSYEDNLTALNGFLNKTHHFVSFEKVIELFPENTPERYMEVIEQLIQD